MLTSPILAVDCSVSESTASAALMKGWMSSMRMALLASRGGGSGGADFIAQHVLDDFVEHLGLHRLLHKMPRALLQCRHDVFLVPHGRDHDDARLGMRAHDALGGLDAFHLRHGDIHEHQIGMDAVIFGNSSH